MLLKVMVLQPDHLTTRKGKVRLTQLLSVVWADLGPQLRDIHFIYTVIINGG
jgi:hypothetical protein